MPPSTRDAKLRWQQVMADYLEVRRSLARHRADGRLATRLHRPRPASFSTSSRRALGNGAVRLLVLLTKVDKLNRSESSAALAAAQGVLAGMTTDEADVGICLFSALKKTGVGDAAVAVHRWAGLDQAN